MTLEPTEAAQLRPSKNPLIPDDVDDDAAPVADLIEIKKATLFARRRRHRRELVDQRRIESAESALERFTRDVEVFGFTKGQFSIIDLLRAALAKTGPAHAVISTWTAANLDITTTLAFLGEGLLLSARWLVDISFQRRQPQLAKRIRDAFGKNAIRVAQNHAKFYMLANDAWRVVIRASMNLNMNPRFEDFHIAHDPELYAFLLDIVDEIWRRQTKTLAFKNPHAIHKHWQAKH